LRRKVKILALDTEGGHGGSSRSLFYLIKNINKKKFKVKVICKKESWIKNEYEKNKIEWSVNKNMPCFTTVQKFSRNLFTFIFFIIYIWPKSAKFRAELIEELKGFDILHCNLITLFFLTSWIKKRIPNIKITMHIRTRPSKNYFSKMQAKISKNIINNFIFITENERKNMLTLLDQNISKGKVIYNPLPDYHKEKKIRKNLKKLKIISLSHYSYERGTDQLILLAKNLPAELKRKIIFIIVGDYSVKLNILQKIYKAKNIKNNLKDYVKSEGVDKMFRFVGRTSNPEKILKNSDILIKLSRENNPWSRDIIEAMGAGKPVISIGSYDKFVKTNKTGLLLKKFNPNLISNWLLKVNNKPRLLNRMGINCKKTVNYFCNQNKQIRKLENLWLKLI